MGRMTVGTGTLDRFHGNQGTKETKTGPQPLVADGGWNRFARGPAPMILLERQLKQEGVTIEYVKNQFEDSPMGDFMKTIAAA